MKNLLKVTGIIAIFAIIGFVMIACGDGGDTKTKDDGKTTTVNPCASGHDFPAWIVPTCTTAGNNERSCTRSGCNETDTRSTGYAALGHDWKYIQDETLVVPTCEAGGHGTRECNRSVCGKKETNVNFEKLGHDWKFSVNESWDVTIIPNCCETGEEQRSCKRNDCTKTEERELPKDENEHDIEVISGEAPTCLTDGYGTIKCKRETCTYTKTGDVLAAPGHHTFVEHWEVYEAATCVATGIDERFCTRGCGEEGNRDTRISGIDNSKHNFNEWQITTAANCTTALKETEKCGRCSALGTKTQEGDAINPSAHNWDNWTVIQPTETTDGGDEIRICSYNENHTENRATGNILYATGTAGLEYELVIGFPNIPDSNSYVVRSGTVTSGEVYIPAFHRPNANSEYLPVTHTGTNRKSNYEGILFRNCRDITAVYFLAPSNITFIGAFDFQGTGITEITLPEGLTYMMGYEFSSTLLTKITIPDGVKNIGDGTFMGCPLKEITLPEGITTIGEGAFRACKNLTEITLPAGLTAIFDDAFKDCTNLTSVTFMGTITASNLGFQNPPFPGDLKDKYLAGGIGTYTTTAPTDDNSIWTKQ